MVIVQQEAKAVIYVGAVNVVVRVGEPDRSQDTIFSSPDETILSFTVKLEPSSKVGRLEPMTEVVIRPKLREEEEPVLPHGSGSGTDGVLLGDGFSRLVNLPLPYEHLIVRLAPLPGISFYKIPFMIIALDFPK